MAVTNLNVEDGLQERSYIRYLDVTFNESAGLAALVAGINDANPAQSTIRLLRYNLDGSGPGVAVPLGSKVQAVDKVLSFDFGAAGIGGNASSAVGDGYYELDFDTNGGGAFNAVEHFYRLFGDVNGDRTVDSLAISPPSRPRWARGGRG